MVIKIPDIAVLRRIKAISELSDDGLIALANQLHIFTAARKELLIKAGSTENASLYIIKGKVSLDAKDGKTTTIEVDESQEMKPIAQLRPCIYDVKALGPVSYLKIEKQKLVEFTQLSDEVSSDISVHSLFNNGNDEDDSVVDNLYRNLIDNSIELPSLPAVAERVQQVYKNDSTNVESMAQILKLYPDISTKINKIARCIQNNQLSEEDKIRFSIEQLGTQAVYCLVMTYSIGWLVNRLPATHMQRINPFWDHSLNVAAISRILAKKTQLFPSDYAMLGGLVHGIGVLLVDDRLLRQNHLMLDHLEIDRAIEAMRPQISSLLLRKWNFNDEFIQVAEECGEWSRDKGAEIDLCDLILAANYFAMMQSDRNYSLPLVNALPAMKKLGITPGEIFSAIAKSEKIKRNIIKLSS